MLIKTEFCVIPSITNKDQEDRVTSVSYYGLVTAEKISQLYIRLFGHLARSAPCIKSPPTSTIPAGKLTPHWLQYSLAFYKETFYF